MKFAACHASVRTWTTTHWERTDRIVQLLICPAQPRKFIIRIEDTDTKAQILQDGERSQLDNLKWMSDWDEGPMQRRRILVLTANPNVCIYAQYIQELMDKGLAYKSYMTEEELEAQLVPGSGPPNATL